MCVRAARAQQETQELTNKRNGCEVKLAMESRCEPFRIKALGKVGLTRRWFVTTESRTKTLGCTAPYRVNASSHLPLRSALGIGAHVDPSPKHALSACGNADEGHPFNIGELS